MSEEHPAKPPQTGAGGATDQDGKAPKGASKGDSPAERKSRYNFKPSNYGGENKDMDVLLTLRDEQFDKRVQYNTFIDKLKNYVLQNFTYAQDVIPIIDKLEDTVADLKTKGPTDLSEDDEKNFVKKFAKQEEIKEHALRLRTLRGNKITLYGIVWGQCSTALQEVIKTDADFVTKDGAFDCIWLLKKCKMVSSGVDDRGNKHNTLVKALLQFCNIRQHQYESNDAAHGLMQQCLLWSSREVNMFCVLMN